MHRPALISFVLTLGVGFTTPSTAQGRPEETKMCHGPNAETEPKVHTDLTNGTVNSLMIGAEALDPRSIATNIPCDHPFWKTKDKIVGSLLVENVLKEKVQLTILIEVRQVLGEHSQSATWNLMPGGQMVFLDIAAGRIVHVFAESSEGTVGHFQIYLDENRMQSQCQATFLKIDRERYGRFQLLLTKDHLCNSDDIQLHPRYRRKGTPLHMTKK